MDNNIKRFMTLFSGYTKAYGTYDARMLDGSGKQKPIYWMAKALAWRYWRNGCRRLSAEIYSATPSIIIKSVSEHSSLTAFAA